MTELTSLIVVQETPSDDAGNFTLGEGSDGGFEGEEADLAFGGRTGVSAPGLPPPPPQNQGGGGGGDQSGPLPEDRDVLFQGANYSPPLQSVDHLLVIGATLLHAIMLLY